MRVIFASLLIAFACIVAAPAREWTARSGGFKVEAELVGVKDGIAILKKPDGAEIAVPLDKLSDGDVRYIKENGATSENDAVPKSALPIGLTEISVGAGDQVTFGPPGCTILLAGDKIWDLEKHAVRTELEGGGKATGAAAISPDGAWIAASGNSPNTQKLAPDALLSPSARGRGIPLPSGWNTAICIYDATTGKRKFAIPKDPTRRIELLALTNQRVFFGRQGEKELLIWNLRTAEQEKSLTLPENLDTKKICFTPDGKSLAMAADHEMLVLRVDTGKPAATMAPPKISEPMPTNPAIPKMQRHASGRTRGNAGNAGNAGAAPVPLELHFIFNGMQAVNFSPDAKALAGFSTNPQPHVICWNGSGKIVEDDPIDINTTTEHFNMGLKWFPDRNAWFVASQVFDRQSRRIVLSVNHSFAQDLPVHVIDQDHLGFNAPEDKSKVKIVAVPWEQIRQSLACMKEKGPALMAPYEPVGVKIEFGELRGPKEPAAAALKEILAMRLARDGVKLADNREAYFRLTYSEKAGQSVQMRQSIPGSGQDTVRQATEDAGTIVVELMLPGQTEPVWRDRVSTISGVNYNVEITDEAIRMSLFRNLAHFMGDLKMPYFVPKSDKLVTIPVFIGRK